jgi:hypothetical protein
MRPAWAIWALVIGAAIQLVVILAPDAYSIVGPYFLVDAPMALRALQSIVPFGLAAAVLVGANRWSEGTPYLRRGASALALAGAAQVLGDAVLTAWTLAGDPPTEAMQAGLPVLYLVRTAAFALAIGFLAAGLWAVGRAGDESTTWRSALRGPRLLLGVVGGVCAVAAVWTAFPPIPPSADVTPVAIFGIVMVAAGIAALAGLAIVALTIRPSSGSLPELLIAAGSTAALMGTAAEWVVPWLSLAGWPPELDLVFTVVGWTRTLGFVALAAGFLTAAGTEHATAAQAA